MSIEPDAIPPVSQRNPYIDPEAGFWLGSLEGLPDLGKSSQPPKDRAKGAGRPGPISPHAWLDGMGHLMPGLGFAALLTYASILLAGVLGRTFTGNTGGPNPVSPILVAIVLGIAIRNLVGLPAVYERGLQWCLKRVLRVGVALLGIRLSLFAAGRTSLTALPIVLGCIITALLLVSVISKRLGLPRRLGFLIAVGTSICGVSAIVATAPVIEAEKDETSYAVSCVAVFGMIALFTYPFLAHLMYGSTPEAAGYFLGTSIHDTSQVAGAGLMYQQLFDQPRALDVAVLTKLVRNLCMAWLIPLVAILFHRNNNTSGNGPQPWYRFIPLFVIGFVAMTAVRTIGDLGNTGRPLGFLSPPGWKSVVHNTVWLANTCLTMAMVAVGLGTSLSTLRRLGLRPLAAGLFAAVLVGGASIALIWLTVLR